MANPVRSYSFVRSSKRALLSIGFLLFGPAWSLWPQAASGGGSDLMLTSRRLVLQGNQRSDEVSVINNGSKPHSYRVKVNYRDMDEKGAMTEREEAVAGERPWQDLIRFSPRQMVLAPGKSQVIRVAVKKPADLPEGEYRYYLTVQLLPDALEPVPASDPKDSVRIQVQTVFGLAIPVIFRNGNLKARAGLEGLRFVAAEEGKAPSLGFRLTRQGQASIYGHLAATFTPAAGGAAEEVGVSKGVAVYADRGEIRLDLPLVSPTGRPFKAGKLHLQFTPDGARSPETQADLDLP